MLSQEELLNKAQSLKKTATIVRDGRGRVQVEREELLTAKQVQAAVATSRRAGELRNEKNVGDAMARKGSNETGVAFPFFCQEEQDQFTVRYEDVVETTNASTVEKGTKNLLRILDEYGVAIVTGVLDEETLAELEESFYADIIDTMDMDKVISSREYRQTLEKFEKHRTTSWPPNYEFQQAWGSAGFLPKRGLPHGKFAWTCRLNSRVRNVFASLFGVAPNELATGLDCPFYKPRIDRSDTKGSVVTKNREWLHVDQNSNLGQWSRCFQGVLYVWPSCEESCSTTVVWPRSHALFEELMRDPYARTCGQQLVQLNSLDARLSVEIHARAGFMARRVAVSDGSLLLWDSRVLHQGWNSGSRLAMPVCWEPKGNGQEIGTGATDAMRRKLWMCAAGIPSTHSAKEARVHDAVAFQKAPEPCDGKNDAEAYETKYINVPLKATLVPWCIKKDLAKTWKCLQETLWGQGMVAKHQAGCIDEPLAETIRSCLREDVLAAL